MGDKVKQKLEQLRSDYTEVVGQPFNFFYCPILFRDEDIPLCQAHIINKAFSGSSKAWTVQRSDVDKFYGSYFEADFEMLQYPGNQSPADIFMDKELRRKLDPKILIDGEQTDYFITRNKIPHGFTPIEFEKDGRLIVVALKIGADEFLAASEGKWEFEISKDVRIASLVSLIKAAYLTLFDMFGYRYALSAAGYFIGRQILGEFFLQNRGNRKPNTLQNAIPFFSEFAHMVRPVQSPGFDFQGTITDRMVLAVWGSSGLPWAIIVFIQTGQLMHCVMLPGYNQADMVSTYLDFLRNQNELIFVTLCEYKQAEAHWEKREPTRLTWPKTGVLYP